jgi:hypothetical protein
MMIQEISLNNIKSQIDLVKQYLISSPDRSITRVEYRTFDEGLSQAYYFICAKSNLQNPLAAFITIYNHKLYFEQEWILADLSTEDVENTIQMWLFPELERLCFDKISADEINQQTAWIVAAIEESISEHINTPRTDKYPNRWGIYVDKQLVSPSKKFKLPVSDRILFGLGLILDWNLIEIFYETPDEYIWFSWATGA